LLNTITQIDQWKMIADDVWCKCMGWCNDVSIGAHAGDEVFIDQHTVVMSNGEVIFRDQWLNTSDEVVNLVEHPCVQRSAVIPTHGTAVKNRAQEVGLIIHFH
jgi:hypothetical protein